MSGFSRFQIWSRAGVAGISVLALTACNPEMRLPFGQDTAPREPVSAMITNQANATGLEVEAPDIYLAEESGLWDGRPSLGGVWVAHPDATDPQRVLVTNQTNGETVVGALFRRERENFGPSFMISSDAAAALNVVAGQPTDLTVVALRRNEVPQTLDLAAPPPPATEVAESRGGSDATALPSGITASSLDAIEIANDAIAEVENAVPTASAASAINVATLAENAIALAATPAELVTADTTASPAAATATAAPSTAPAPVAQTAALSPLAAPAPPQTGHLDRPYIQIGLYAVEANALGAADDMRAGGVVPTVLDQSSATRALWRVIVGPARSTEERAALLETIKGMGYQDAYFVTN